MEPDREVISRRLNDLAGQAGPLRTQDLRRLVRRRRKLQATSAGFACAGLAAGALGLASLLSGQAAPQPPGHALATGPAGDRHPPTYCGAPRRASPIPPDPQASGPADQPVLDGAAQKIDAIGGGKAVTHGWQPPGKFAPWYGGVEISTEWREVIVYRLPHPALDAAICGTVHDVTVELRDAVQSAVAANRLASQIMASIDAGHHAGFLVFGVAINPDGTITIGTDHLAAARRAFARYGPYVLVVKGQAMVPKSFTARD